jgi:hypothetical protein
MPSTNPTTIKLTDAEKARLLELGRLFGTPGHPMPLVGVIRKLMWDAETPNGRKKKTSRES